MNDETLTQLGLTFVYFAVTGLMALLQRLEKSTVIRIWMYAFLGLGIDAAVSTARMAMDLPAYVQVISWLALASGSLAAVIGTLRFIGRGHVKYVYVLGATVVLVLGGGTALGLSPDTLRPMIFSIIGVAFTSAGGLILAAGIRGGAGRWVAGSAFFAAALYSFSWPWIRDLGFAARLEFYLDLVVLVWGANGVLLMHFDRSRKQVKALAAQELALREKLDRTERTEALGRLAAGVAHDFNNVLTLVINGTDLVLRQIEDRPKAAERLRMVRSAAEGAVGFTRQLLVLGRRRLPGQKPIRLSDALEGALRIVRPSVPSNVELDAVDVSEALAVKAADGQLEQLTVNLCLNALDAMPDGGRLSIRTSLVGDKARISVSDTGVGMDTSLRERIFDPFFTTKDSGGCGLGLATAYAAVQQLGGDIFVDSTPGKGSTFTLELPTCEPPLRPTPEPPGVPFEGVRVLVVDDNAHVAMTLADGLREAGFSAEGMSDPEAALAAALENPPDVLLSDVWMPGLDGPELAEKLREKHPSVRVLLMSGVAQQEDRPSFIGDMRLVKPVTVPQLTQTLQSLLSFQKR